MQFIDIDNKKLLIINNKYMKECENKEYFYLIYWHVVSLYCLEMSQKLLVNNSEWIEDNSQFNEN